MRKIILLVIVVGLFGYQEEWKIVKNRILGDELNGKAVYVFQEPLPGGEGVSSWRSSHKAPFDSYLFFIDDYPDANWEHPARLVFAKGSKIEIIEVLALPYLLAEMVELTMRPDHQRH